MVILTYLQYLEICEFIKNYQGLPIDCELELKKHFNGIDQTTLYSITNLKWQYLTKKQYPYIAKNAKRFLTEFHKIASKTNSVNILLDIALRENYPAMALCRLLLYEQFKEYPKSRIAGMLKNPDLIPNKYDLFAANVLQCSYNDNREGNLPDMLRRCVGEEYEIKLKEMAKSVGMIFHDENDLRRKGFDKTPDLKLAIPCLYNGKVIHWIESKALFGDLETHQKYIRDQLDSYGNRFGPGLVIYWFGCVENIIQCKENGDLIYVTDTFPSKEHLEFLTFSD